MSDAPSSCSRTFEKSASGRWRRVYVLPAYDYVLNAPRVQPTRRRGAIKRH